MKKTRIAIIGSGVVGQATGKGFNSKGFDITFIDVNPKIVENLKNEGFNAYLASETIPQTDISIFTVPTPTIDDAISLEYLKNAAKDLGKRLATMNNYHLAVVRSTVPPGTTESIISILEEYSGKKVGKDFGVCMNPEYLREVSSVEDFANPWIVVIGEYDKKSGNTLEEIYRVFDCPIHHVSLTEAEMQKYVHNLYNASKITFFNEMRRIAKEIGVDADKIFELTTKSCEGIWNHSYGTKDFGPFGGACLPKDTQAFLAWAKSEGLQADLLEATISVNKSFEDNTSLKETSSNTYTSLPL